MLKKNLPSIILSVLYIIVLTTSGCLPSGHNDDTTSAKFGGMANIDATETRKAQEHVTLIEGDGYPCIITDYLGYEVTLFERPERIAVLSGAFLDMCYAMGGK